MLFNRNTEKETSKVLLRENKRLKCENQRLRESIEGLQRYKDEYKELTNELSDMKKRYMEKVEEFGRLEERYESALVCLELENNDR